MNSQARGIQPPIPGSKHVELTRPSSSQSIHFNEKFLSSILAAICAGLVAANLDRSLAFSHSRALVPASEHGSRPVYQWTAIPWCFCSLRASGFAIAPGLQSGATVAAWVKLVAVWPSDSDP